MKNVRYQFAVLRRWSILVFLAGFQIASFATITVSTTFSNWIDANNGGIKYPTALAACIGSVQSFYGPTYTATVGAAHGTQTSTFQSYYCTDYNSSGTVISSTGDWVDSNTPTQVAPANATCDVSGNCSCNSGYTDNGLNQCVSTTNNCASLVGGNWGVVQASSSASVQGCSSTPSGDSSAPYCSVTLTPDMGITAPGRSTAWLGNAKYDGGKCSTPNMITTTQQAGQCPAGQAQGTGPYGVYCYVPVAGQNPTTTSPGSSSTSTTAGGGTPTTATSSSDSTTCDGTNCTTTTTYKDSTGSTVGTRSTVSSQSAYCTSNPTASVCAGVAEGACAENPTLVGCSTLGTPSGSSSLTTSDSGFSSITPLALTSVTSCPAPASFVVLGSTYSLSFSSLCSNIQSYVAPVVLVLGAALASFVFVGGFKS